LCLFVFFVANALSFFVSVFDSFPLSPPSRAEEVLRASVFSVVEGFWGSFGERGGNGALTTELMDNTFPAPGSVPSSQRLEIEWVAPTALRDHEDRVSTDVWLRWSPKKTFSTFTTVQHQVPQCSPLSLSLFSAAFLASFSAFSFSMAATTWSSQGSFSSLAGS
jgi:hypothetical protein